MWLLAIACLPDLTVETGTGTDTRGPGPDSDPVEMCTGFSDEDGDGFGVDEVSFPCDNRPAGVADRDDDCNDSEPAIHPAADEVCNDGVDDDCNGLADDDDAGLYQASGTALYEDGDADGFGREDSVVYRCNELPGFVETAGDCDDSNGEAYPGAEEICNGLDDDCDDLADSDEVCPCPVYRHDEHVYLFCESVRTWGQAREDCGQGTRGFDLVRLDSDPERTWVTETAADVDGERWWWIGLRQTDKYNEPAGSWHWVDDQQMNHPFWAEGQPDNQGGGEDCAHLYPDSGRWNDLECHRTEWYGTQMYFVCESS
jgi:hypothetical protein